MGDRFPTEITDHVFRLKQKIYEITYQDILIVLVCLSAVYLLRSRDTYEIVPVWRKDLDVNFYLNGKFPGVPEQMPVPVVTDIESDGLMEIILITNDHKLEIYFSPKSTEDSVNNGYSLPYIIPVQAVDLNLELSAYSNDSRPLPIIIKTGYIDVYNETDDTQLRKQVIVIGLSNWTVLCYDSQLELMWKRQLLDDLTGIENHYKVEAMAITVTSYSLAKSDRGSVFVGINMEHSHGKENNEHQKPKYQSPRMHQMGSQMHKEKVNEETLSHFSTFALSGDKGEIRWSHLPDVFRKDTENVMQFSHWKLNIHDSSTHSGKVHWTKYLKHVLQHMPHYWSELSDTSIEMIDLKHTPQSSHHSHGEGRQPFSPLTDILGLDEQHIAGLPFGGMRPHNQHEHIKTPSSLFIHNHKGIEILQLETGRPVTMLSLSNERCVYADIEGQGNLDSMCLDACTAEAERIHPMKTKLFTGPTCESPSFFGPVSFMAALTSHKYMNEDSRRALPPVLVKSIGRRSGMFSHLLGRTLKSERKGYDSVFMSSSGRVTSYSPHGQLNWQVLVNTGWDSFFTGQGSYIEINYHDREQMYNGPFKPSIVPFSPLVFGRETNLLLFGWTSMTIVDLYDGYSLSDNSLPCQPIQKPVIADFNGDGKNDIIISCSFGYVGVTIERARNYIYTCVTAVCVVAVVLLLSWCCQPEEEEENYYQHQHSN